MASQQPTANALGHGQKIVTRTAGPVGAAYAVSEKNWVL